MEVPLTAFGSLRPLFRYRSIPPLRSGTAMDGSGSMQEQVCLQTCSSNMNKDVHV